MDLSVLPTAADLAVNESRAPRWRPGLARQPLHSEIFACTREASGAGTALALVLEAIRVGEAGRDERPEKQTVLWVQDAAAVRLTGRPYRAGLPEELRRRLVHVTARDAADALFALEEGVRCRDLACVIGEITGNPRALDFTASRRLSLAAEKHGVPLFLVRLDAARDLSSARMRWQVAAAPSPAPRWNAEAPGPPTWRAELFRARDHAPGEWILHHDQGRLLATKPAERDRRPLVPPDHGDLAGAAGGGPLAAF